MSDVQQRIDELVKGNRVVLFMKGTAQFPMCGFSGRAIQILKACGADDLKTVNVLEDEEVRQVERRLAHHEQQAPALLQGDVGGAGEQVVGETVGDGGQRLHRAGGHDHGRGVEAAAGQAGAHVARGMGLVGQGLEPAPVQTQFMMGVEHTRGRDDEVRLYTQRAGARQQLHAVDRTGGAGDADDQALRRGHLKPWRAPAAIRRSGTSPS